MGRMHVLALGMAMGLTGLLGSPSVAQDAELKKEVEELKKGQQNILGQLEEIKKLLQARPQAQPSGPNVAGKVFRVGDNPAKGSSTAQLTLLEFTDYQ